MSLLRATALVLVLVCLTQLSDALDNNTETLKVRTQSTPSELFKDKHTYFHNSLGMDQTSLHFVECDPSSSSTGIRECRLLRGIQSFTNKTEWKACGFQMKPDKNSRKVTPYMRVYHFNFSFLVFWIEIDRSSVEVKHVNDRLIQVNSYIKFIVIESATCRVTGEARTIGSSKDLKWFQLQQTVSVYMGKETFDVVYAYNKAFDLAQESFDMYGTRIRGPVGEEDFRMDQFATTIPWPSINRLSSCFNMWPQERLKARPGYKLEYHPTDALGKHGQDVLGYTTSNNNVTFCKETNTQPLSLWTCLQGEPNKTATKFYVKFDYLPHTPIIHNMPGGGLLAMTSQETRTVNSTKTYTFYAQRFETNGRYYKPVEILKLDCQFSTLLLGNIFEDVWGYFCFSFLQDKRFSTFTTKCFAEDVLLEAKNPVLLDKNRQ